MNSAVEGSALNLYTGITNSITAAFFPRKTPSSDAGKNPTWQDLAEGCGEPFELQIPQRAR